MLKLKAKIYQYLGINLAKKDIESYMSSEDFKMTPSV